MTTPDTTFAGGTWPRTRHATGFGIGIPVAQSKPGSTFPHFSDHLRSREHRRRGRIRRPLVRRPLQLPGRRRTPRLVGRLDADGGDRRRRAGCPHRPDGGLHGLPQPGRDRQDDRDDPGDQRRAVHPRARCRLAEGRIRAVRASFRAAGQPLRGSAPDHPRAPAGGTGRTSRARTPRRTSAVNLPRAESGPATPILVGSSGDRMLGLLARYGDAWDTGWGGKTEELKAKVAKLEAACAAAGRDPQDGRSLGQRRRRGRRASPAIRPRSCLGIPVEEKVSVPAGAGGRWASLISGSGSTRSHRRTSRHLRR